MGRKPKPAGDTAAPKAVKSKKISNIALVDPATKKQFLEMRDEWSKKNDAANSATGRRRNYEKEIKKAGFKMSQIKDSIMLSTPEGEAAFKADIANRLLAAAYSDADIGEQLSMFLDEPRVPAVDRAKKEGQTDCMSNKPARPKYDPSTEQHRAYMESYHAEQERQIKGGIKKLDDKKAAANARGGELEKAATGKKRGRPAKPKGPNADPPAGSERTLITKADKDAKAAARAPKPDSGPPRQPAAARAVTRASVHRAAAEAAKDEAETYFTKAGTAGNA